MKVIWLSANKLGYELLKEAMKLDCFVLKAIITLSPKSKVVMYDGFPIEMWKRFGVGVFQLQNPSNIKALIDKMTPDLIVMCGWRGIIKKDLLNIIPSGIVGFHPTLLPFGRGPAPVINTILRGSTVSGLTMYYVSEGLDKGDIIAQVKFSIKETDHAQDVYNRIIKAGKELIRKYFPLIIKGNAPRVPQDESKAVVFTKPSLDSNKIDLNKESLEQVYRKIKALSAPYKGAYIEKEGKKLIIWRAELECLK